MRNSKKDKYESHKYVNITIYKYNPKELNKDSVLNDKLTESLNKGDIEKRNISSIRYDSQLNNINKQESIEEILSNLAKEDNENNFQCKPIDDDLFISSTYLDHSDPHSFNSKIDESLITDLQNRGMLIDSSIEIERIINAYLNISLIKKEEETSIIVDDSSLSMTDFHELSSSQINSVSISEPYEEKEVIKQPYEEKEVIKQPYEEKEVIKDKFITNDTHEIFEYFPLNYKRIKINTDILTTNNNNKKFSTALQNKKNYKNELEVNPHLHKIFQKTLIKKDEERNVFIKKNILVEEYSKTDSGDCYECEEAEKYLRDDINYED